jgi:hypothetical protein
MLMSWRHGDVGIAIHPDMVAMEIHDIVPYESCFINKIVCLRCSLREAVGRTPPLHDE